MTDTERARDALYAIPPDLQRDEWVRVGMSAHAAGLDFDAFDAWSAGAANYDPGDARAVWRSFKPDKGVKAGTLFRMAQEHGWRRKRRRQAPATPAPSPQEGTRAAAQERPKGEPCRGVEPLQSRKPLRMATSWPRG